jgi:hypothetical protein
MKKIIIATLGFVAAFALVVGISVNGSAQAALLGKPSPTSSSHWYSTSGSSPRYQSDVYNWGSKGKNRKVDITVKNNSLHTMSFGVTERTGSGSIDNYFDGKGNEVYSQFNRATYNVAAGDTKKVTVKMGDSSTWKDRDGVYLEGFAPSGSFNVPNYNNVVSYTFSAE